MTINKVFLAQSYTHSLKYCLCLLWCQDRIDYSCDGDHMASKATNIYHVAPHRKSSLISVTGCGFV